MACVNKLKLLKNEISRLFRAGLDEKDVFNQLRSDEKFADATREHVQSFYNRLQDESNAKVENEQQIAINDQEIAELQRQIDEHERLVPENEQAIAEHQQQLVGFQHELGAKQQLKFDLAFGKHEQNSNKFLIHEAVSSRSFRPRRFWQKRFFMQVEDDEPGRNSCKIKVLDLLQGETKTFTVGKVGELLCCIFALKIPYVLLLERDFERSSNAYLRLVKFDFESNSLQNVQSFEFTDDCTILPNASNALKFLLSEGNAVKECKLVGGKIQIGKTLALDEDFEFTYISYFDEQVCQFHCVEERNDEFNSRKLTQVKMIVCNLEQNQRSIYDLNSTHVKWPWNEHYVTWMRDTVFFTVQFPLTQKFGVIYANPRMPFWKLVEFAPDLPIYCLQSFSDGTLMVCAKERNVEQRKSKFYKLQMCKPDSLRNMAWTAMVKLLKEAEIEKPYEQAREVLPLNSEINSFMLTEN